MKQTHGWWFPDHETHLTQWLAHPKNNVFLNGRLAYQGKKQVASLEACKSFRTALDCGAHCGTWSFNLAERFKHVHSFEPVAEHRACFEKNVDADNVTLHAVALGSEPGFVSMVTEPGSSGNTTVGVGNEVEMIAIDSLGLREVDFCKIDVEGFELNILRGARETILRWKPVIIVEQKRDMAMRFDLPVLGAVDYLKNLGYRVVQEISGDYLMSAG